MKLLKLLGERPASLPDLEPDGEDWYANLLWLERRKCLLVTHAATLFTAFASDVRKADLVPLGPAIVNLIRRELRAEGLPAFALGQLDATAATLARTADRSVLGCMNDNAWLCEFTVARSGGLARTNLAELNHQLRLNIHSSRGYARPLELVKLRVRAG